MNILQEIRNTTDGLSTSEMLRYLLKEKFPGEVAVTASLKSPSIVTLKLISEIDPSTSVIFCQPLPIFPESKEYRAEIVDVMGLTNVKVVTLSDPLISKRAFERCERLWNERLAGGKNRETIHLNDTLSPYKCWIKAVYHDKLAKPASSPLAYYAGMVIVDPLHDRTSETIDRFMQVHGLPYHPKVRYRKRAKSPPDGSVTGFQFG